MNPTTADLRHSTLSIQKRISFVAGGFLLLSLLSLSAVEIILRLKGFEPWSVKDQQIAVDPGGKLFQKDPKLGYRHLPGRFTITEQSEFHFTITHLPNTLRVTHDPAEGQHSEREGQIWIFGCSLTHGWGLNDNETYPWLVQEQFPNHEVVNFGVSGYGTIHSLIQFRTALERTVPKVVVLAYGHLHDHRNTFSRTRRKGIASYNKLGPLIQPYARLEGAELHFHLADAVYHPFPFMRYSAAIHFLEEQYNQYEDKSCRSHDVSKALVEAMICLAEKHSIPFVLAGITRNPNTADMIQYVRGRGGIGVDISVELDQDNINPYDRHPVASVDRQYASKLLACLQELDP